MDVRKIINDTFLGKVKAENVDENTPINKLGLDSLDLMEALMDLEEKFGFEFESINNTQNKDAARNIVPR